MNTCIYQITITYCSDRKKFDSFYTILIINFLSQLQLLLRYDCIYIALRGLMLLLLLLLIMTTMSTVAVIVRTNESGSFHRSKNGNYGSRPIITSSMT